MSSTVKSHKDKPYTAVPRLTPRPTAASAARAARNATNRNLNTPVTQRLSPARSPPSPVTSRVKTAIQRGGRSDSKTEIKVNKNREHETSQIADIVPDNQNIVFEVEEVNGNLEQAIPVDNSVNNTRNNDDNNNEVKDKQETFNNSGLPEIETPVELPNENDDEMCTRTPVNSRPHTPIINRPPTPVLSRPQTPKTANRPQTPRIQSRPSTPINVTQRNNTPHSRPNTPQKSTMAPRPKTPAKPIATRPVTPIASNAPRTCETENVDVRTVYFAKQKQFHRLKKELDIKQQAVLEVFDHLRNLHERMVSEGVSASGEGLSELVLLNVADWTENEINQLCRTTVDPSLTEGAVELFNTTVPIDENALADIESKAMNIPSCFADLCLQAFTARQELIDWIKEYLEKEEDANSDALDRISSYNNRGLEMCEALRDLKARAEDAVHTITLLSKRACRERATLISVGESLVREVARLRQDLESRTTVISEIHEIPTESETVKALDETRRELEEERASKATMKEKLSTTEAQLRQQRIRISKMDRQLREAEASITSLTSTVKSLEDQSRQREVQLEARARKLRESLKTGEVTSSHLAQQRDTLEAQVSDLNEQIKTMTVQHKTNIQEVNNKLNELTLTLEAERESSRREIELKNALQENLKESQFTIEELKSKINEFERNKPNPDLPTEREMDLWAELQAIKDTLRITEEEVIACKREKVRFLETLTKIAESDNKVGLQQKLAAELLSKEEIISKMQTQARDLTKNIKLNEQKLIQYEQYVRDLQAHNRAIANCQESPNGISYQDLQQEIMDLKMGLLDAVHKNEELSEMLAQKDQQLEQQDKTSRAQARVIKVREELINMLKNKETEQSRELAALQHDLEHRMKIVDEVNKQIAAKADEIQELFATLETKQQQIHRLEKIVIALEEQQRRAQAQRTRHEEKIAALEHEIAAGGNRKDRKFIFF